VDSSSARPIREPVTIIFSMLCSSANTGVATGVKDNMTTDSVDNEN